METYKNMSKKFKDGRVKNGNVVIKKKMPLSKRDKVLMQRFERATKVFGFETNSRHRTNLHDAMLKKFKTFRDDLKLKHDKALGCAIRFVAAKFDKIIDYSLVEKAVKRATSYQPKKIKKTNS